MTGLEDISQAFGTARQDRRAALMPYFSLGFPSAEASIEIVFGMARAGADLIELGLPFSDPLADGPTIQHSTQVALQQGTSMAGCLEMVTRIRRGGVRQPLLLMGYVNPIVAYGMEKFVEAAARAGASGLIIPDLPPEEAGVLKEACASAGLALVFLLAPTSTPERVAVVTAQASGFIYLVSVAGITGVRDSLPPDLPGFIARVRAQTSLPLAVGFGVSTPAQAREVGRMAEGVIVGSAIIRAAEAGNEAVEDFVRGLRAALEAVV